MFAYEREWNSQVFFVDDIVQPKWKVVMLHEPRARRVLDDVDEFYMGAAGWELTFPTRNGRVSQPDEEDVHEPLMPAGGHGDMHVPGVEIAGAQMHAVDAAMADSDD
jgi:hypothetical protein